jgi:hypothetical protein
MGEARSPRSAISSWADSDGRNRHGEAVEAHVAAAMARD